MPDVDPESHADCHGDRGALLTPAQAVSVLEGIAVLILLAIWRCEYNLGERARALAVVRLKGWAAAEERNRKLTVSLERLSDVRRAVIEYPRSSAPQAATQAPQLVHLGAMPEATGCGRGASRAVRPERTLLQADIQAFNDHFDSNEDSEVLPVPLEPRPLCMPCVDRVQTHGGHWLETRSATQLPCDHCEILTVNRLQPLRTGVQS